MLTLLIVVVLAALIFDYINGFHDAANAIATSVATGVLPLRTAVMIAAMFNLIGALVGTSVAKFFFTSILAKAVPLEQVTQVMILAALIGASAWNLLTWVFGIPSSSSHALIGGIVGAILCGLGRQALNWQAIVEKAVIPLAVAPLVGFTLALVIVIALLWIFRRMRPGRVNRVSRGMQLGSASLMAFSHGSNDAQKAMGVITLALLAGVAAHIDMPAWMRPGSHGIIGKDGKPAVEHLVPMWVVISCATAMAVGTMAGGKRIIKTMGAKIVRISPLQGFAAEAAGSITIFSASLIGIPLSTTHTINAAIMGVGASKRINAVRWTVASRILIAWVLTIPMSAGVAAGAYWLIIAFAG